MGEFITLTCPSCGGKLQVSPNTSVLNCQHCGTEHLVRRDAGGISLESFARCPQCGRNDRVEKVSAILRSHSQEVTTTERRTETYYDQNGNPRTRIIEVPVTHTQVTGLARSFVPPGKKPKPLPKPELLPNPVIKSPNSKKNLLLVTGSLLVTITSCFLIILIWGLVNDPSIEVTLLCGLPTLASLCVGIFILIQGIKKKTLGQDEIEISEEEKEQKLKDWQEKNEQIINIWQENNRVLQESWQRAMTNWKNLYYCHRDDCIFIPNKGTYAPIEKVRQYIYEDKQIPDGIINRYHAEGVGKIV